jgi:protein gp37
MGEYGLYVKGSRFQPRFFPERLDQPQKVKADSRIFVCSMGDLFGKWVPRGWVDPVLRVAQECPQHTLLFLTKNPKGMQPFEFPDNCWVGISADNPRDADDRLAILGGVRAAHTFVSFEPLLDDICDGTHLDGLGWVIVGAQTGPSAVKPQKEWVENIIDEAWMAGIPLFLKDNLGWTERIQQFPREADANDAV